MTSHAGAHSHAPGPRKVLALGLVLTLAFAAVEVLAGVLSGSLALISDAGHMLVDSAGLVLALAAAVLARRPADLRRTYGYARVEVLVVPVHVTLMLGVAAYILVEAALRFGDPPEVDALPVLAIGVLGLLVNLVALRLLHGSREHNMNVQGAWMEVAADTAGSAGVILAAVIVMTTGWNGADVLFSVLIAVFIVPRALLLLRRAVSVLLEGAPRGIDTASIEALAAEVPGVRALHDLHVWALTPSFVALSAHVEVASMDGCEVAIARLASLLRDRHGIDHVTLQPETPALHDAIACCLYPDQAPLPAHAHG